MIFLIRGEMFFFLMDQKHLLQILKAFKYQLGVDRIVAKIG